MTSIFLQSYTPPLNFHTLQFDGLLRWMDCTVEQIVSCFTFAITCSEVVVVFFTDLYVFCIIRLDHLKTVGLQL